MGMWSNHSEEGLNETHNLLGVEIDGYFLYKFENSQNDSAYYVGTIDRDIACLYSICLGYSAGFMQGYDFKAITPIGFGVVSYTHQGFGLDLSCLPKLVCAWQLRFSDEAFEYFDWNAPWNTKGYMELSLDHFDPDGEGSLGYERNNGAAYDIKLYLTDNVFIKGNYTQTDFGAQPDQGEEKFTPVWSTGKPTQISSTGYIEFGYDFDNFTLSGSINQISVQENTLNRGTGKITETPNKHHRGVGVHISTDYQISDDFKLELKASIVDRLIKDLELSAGLVYNLTDDINLTVGFNDWERWNYTKYQAGIRFNF